VALWEHFALILLDNAAANIADSQIWVLRFVKRVLFR
jgi:hypothetical protein